MYSILCTPLPESSILFPLPLPPAKFQPKLEKFESLKLDKNPFIITSVIGQELQTANHMDPAVRILEAARAIGTDSLKLQASLLQALGRVHWILGNTDKALQYMEQDLRNNESLEDSLGCCRAHESLGTALFSLGRYQEAVLQHTQQHMRAQSVDPREAVSALTRLGQALGKMSNFQAALKAYKDSLKIAKDVGDHTLIARAYSHLGSTHISAQDVEKAIMWHHQHLTFAKETQNKAEEAEAYGHLGHACFLKSNFEQSMMFYQQLLSVAVQLNDLVLKARAYGGMGQANRAMGNLWHAQSCREQQLKISKDLGDNESQLTALNHLGHIHKAAGKLSQAMQCYTECLELAQKVKDRGGEGRAYANLGSCHMALGSYRDAVNYYKQELVISQERGDKASEATTLGHLGSAFLALDSRQAAQEHMQKSLKLAEEIGDKVVQCHALSNLGNYHTSTKRHTEALPCLEKALQLTQELKDAATESKVCHNLGLCHEGLGHYRQAIQYYQHDFLVAKEAQDKEGMTRACEKLMRAHSENGDKEQADAYKRKLHTIAEEIQNTSGKCTFWNQIAEDALNSGDYDKAVEYYENLLKEAKKEQHQSFEGLAYCGLGNACLSRGGFEHALSYHRRDLSLRKAAHDITGECQAYGNMGAAYNSLAQHQQAVECYEHQLALAKQLENAILMTKAYGCLGIVQRNMKNFHKALQYHHLQVQSSLQLKDNLLEQASSHANLGDSFEAVGDFLQAVRQHEHHLSLSQRAHNDGSQIRALSSLGRAHRGLGNLRKALGYFERQLKLSKVVADEYIEAECYADIGSSQMLVGDYNRALESFSSQLSLSRSLQDPFSEAMAACGLGEVHARLGNFREAIDYHKLDHRISSANRFLDGEARALGNIAETYESMGEYKAAIDYREKQLSAADTLRDNFSKALAFTGLGKIHIKMSDYTRAVTLLKQALSLVVDQTASESNAHTQTEIEVEAKIRFYLGQAFYYQSHFEAALVYLRKALPLFEHMRQNVGHYDHATKQTLELYPFLFQTLVNTLVRQGKVEDALEMAEMERNRAITDALAQRDVSRQAMKEAGLMKQYTPNSSWIQDAIEAIQTPVLYFAVALNHIFIWMLHPKSGIVQFQQVDMQDFALPGSDSASIFSESSSSYIQPLVDSVATVREALGVEQRYRLATKSVGSGISDDFDSGDDNESTIGSTASAPAFRPNNGAAREDSIGMSHHKGAKKPVNMAPVHDLYDILIKPLEYVLPQAKCPGGTGGKVVIIPDKDLYLVPFSLLRGEGMSECLYQRYHLQFVPSLQALIPPTPRPTPKISRKQSLAPGSVSRSPSPTTPTQKTQRRSSSPNPLACEPDSRKLSQKPRPLLVSNPAIPVSGAHCPWHSLIGVEKETRLLADLLEVKPLSGKAASKEAVVKRLGNAECVHFITNVSWERGQLVLGPRDDGHSDSEDSVDGQGAESRASGDGAVVGRRGVADGAVNALPEPREFLLTVSELMELRLPARLVVISGAHHSDGSRVSAKGLMCLAQAFLCSGVECVVLPLWATSLQASRLMMNAFYSSLMYGSRASRALAYGMQVSGCCTPCVLLPSSISLTCTTCTFHVPFSGGAWQQSLQPSRKLGRLSVNGPGHCTTGQKPVSDSQSAQLAAGQPGGLPGSSTAPPSVHGEPLRLPPQLC